MPACILLGGAVLTVEVLVTRTLAQAVPRPFVAPVFGLLDSWMVAAMIAGAIRRQRSSSAVGAATAVAAGVDDLAARAAGGLAFSSVPSEPSPGAGGASSASGRRRLASRHRPSSRSDSGSPRSRGTEHDPNSPRTAAPGSVSVGPAPERGCRPIDQIGVGGLRLERMRTERLFGFPLTILVDVDHDHVDGLAALVLDLGAIPFGTGSAILAGELLDGTAFRGTDEIRRTWGPASR